MNRSQVAAAGVRFALWRAEPARRPRRPPVLALHGIPQTGEMWRRVGAELGRDRVVLAPDLKGLGDSEPVGRYDLATLVGELAALVLHETDGPVDVVGHDWGGVLGLSLAARRPELVRRLVLAGAPYGRPDPRAWHVAALALPVVPEIAFAAGGRGLVRAMLRHGWRADRPLDPLQRERYAAAYAEPARVAAMLSYYRTAVRPAPRRALDRARTTPPQAPAAVRRPRPQRALVLWGAADPVLPLRLAETATRRLGPAATLVTVPRAGHFVVDEAPDVAVATVAEFVRAG